MSLPDATRLGILDALERRKLLVCVGPLVAMAAGLPGPRELVERCRIALRAEGLDDEGVSADNSVAQALRVAEAQLGSAAFIRLVRAAWEPLVPIPETARALVGLSPGLNGIVTTNLDRLLERAFEGQWHAADEAAADIAKRTRVIFKIRGTIDRPTGWVLTARQEQNASFFGVLLRRELEALLRSHVLLLVGFEPDDEVVQRLLEVRGHPVADARHRSSETTHPDLMLAPAAACSSAARDRLGKRGIELLPVHDDYDRETAQYLHDLARELGKRTQRFVPVRGADVEPAEPSAENPYPGLEPFTEANRRYFFGREDDVARVLGRLGGTAAPLRQWLLVDGPSGVGKSSFLQAGLLPALRDGAGPSAGPRHTWRVVIMRPGPAPLFELAEQLHRAVIRDPTVAGSASDLGARVGHAASALGEFLAAHLAEDEGLLLLVDQLEEALLIPNPGDREPFASALADLLVHSPRPLLLVTGMRSDFSGDLPRLPALHERVTSAAPPVRYTLAALSTGQLAMAIEGPAREAHVELEAGLTERILADAGQIEHGNARGDGTPETVLPLVAAVVASLYTHRDGRRLTHDAYDALGGVAGALTRRADEVLAPLLRDYSEEQLWGVFRGLVETEARGRATRRSVSRVDALSAAGGGSRGEALLARLAGSEHSMRIVVVCGEGANARVNLVHEALLRGWSWLSQHIDRDSAELLHESELIHAAEHWERRGRPRDGLPRLAEAAYFLRPSTAPGSLARAYQVALRAQARRRRFALGAVFTGLASAALIFAGLSFYAVQQTDRANGLLVTAKGITTDLLGEVLPKYEDIPGTSEVQIEIHERLARILATLHADAESDTDTLDLEIKQKIMRGDLALSHERIDQAREEFAQALALAEHAVQRSPGTVTAESRLSDALYRRGNVEVRAGDPKAARQHLVRAIEIGDRLATVDPRGRRGLSIALNTLGSLEVADNDLVAARACFERSVALAEALAAEAPDHPQSLRDLAFALALLGDLEIRAANLAAARHHYEHSFRIGELLEAKHPTSAKDRRGFAMSVSRLGDLAVQTGDVATARARYHRALEYFEALRAADQRSAQAGRDLFICLYKLGELEAQAGDVAAVRSVRERAVELTAVLSSQDPTSAVAKRDHMAALVKIGEVALQADDIAAARGYFERALATCESAVGNAEGKRDLTVVLSLLGELEAKSGDLSAARRHLERFLSISEELARGSPDNAQAQRDLALAADKLADLEVRAGKLAIADDLYRRATTIMEAQVVASPDQAEGAFHLVELHLDRLELARKQADPRARHTHAEAAMTQLTAMDMRGQIRGIPAREQAMQRVASELGPPAPR